MPLTAVYQAMGGETLEVGSRVRWTLAPASVYDRGLARRVGGGELPVVVLGDAVLYGDESSEGDWMAGVVLSVTGVRLTWRPVPGEPGSYTSDGDDPVLETVHRMTEEQDVDAFDQHVVTLQVDDDTVLPPPDPDQAQDFDPEEASRRAMDARRQQDATGRALEALADAAERTYGQQAAVTRQRGRSAASVVPHRDGGAAVHWARSSWEPDGVRLQVGDGVWELPAAPPTADVLAEFLDAAASGRVTEDVMDVGGPGRLVADLETTVVAEDGRVWTARERFAPTPLGEDEYVGYGDGFERFERGRHRYLPWD